MLIVAPNNNDIIKRELLPANTVDEQIGTFFKRLRT